MNLLFMLLWHICLARKKSVNGNPSNVSSKQNTTLFSP